MRRKSTGPKEPALAYDILGDVNPEKLRYFAGIALVWNYIEAFIDASLVPALNLDGRLGLHVSSRINGMDGKIALLKEAIRAQGAKDDVRHDLSKTLNAVEHYKRLRDGVVHVRIVHPDADVADTVHRRGVADEVLISADALKALYERMCFVGGEANQLFRVLSWSAIGGMAKSEAERRDNAMLAEQALARLRSFQAEREALPPLPRFPDELLTP